MRVQQERQIRDYKEDWDRILRSKVRIMCVHSNLKKNVIEMIHYVLYVQYILVFKLL